MAKVRCFLLPVWILGNASAFSPIAGKSPVISSKPGNQATATELGALAFLQKQQPKAPELIQGVGPEGCQLPSPSRVNTLPKPAQAKAVFGIFAALGLGTSLLTSTISDNLAALPWFQTFELSWPITMGLVYTVAGVTHFTVEDEYCNIYPAQGSWGIWYLPGSPQFHVQWTGVAEILGGVGLLLGGGIWELVSRDTVPNVLTSAGLVSDSAAALFLLTLAVTPSNIYMYTHGARLPKEGPPVPIAFHAVRGLLQIVLLTLLYEMGQGTFQALLS